MRKRGYLTVSIAVAIDVLGGRNALAEGFVRRRLTVRGLGVGGVEEAHGLNRRQVRGTEEGEGWRKGRDDIRVDF